jgi:hypothetical protein
MRLKKAGFIGDDRRFVRQPTPEQIENALEPDRQEGGDDGPGGGIFNRLFGDQ